MTEMWHTTRELEWEDAASALVSIAHYLSERLHLEGTGASP